MLIYPRVNPIKSDETTIFLRFSYGFPMVFLWFGGDLHPLWFGGENLISKSLRTLGKPAWGVGDYQHCAGRTCRYQFGTLNGYKVGPSLQKPYRKMVISALSMGWLKGKSTGNHRFSHEIWDFPVIFPLNQSIDLWTFMILQPGWSLGNMEAPGVGALNWWTLTH